MNRVLSLLLTAALLAAPLTGCTGPTPSEEDGRLSVVATLFPYYDFVRQIGGQRVNAQLLLSPGRESHSFEPTPLDVIRMQKAAVFVYNGGVDEHWVTEVLAGLEDNGQTRLCMLEQVDILEEELAEGMEAESGHVHSEDEGPDAHAYEDGGAPDDHDEIEYDEHIWTSPLNATLLSAAVCDALSAADPAGEDYYRANLADYQLELVKLSDAFRNVVSQGQRRTLVFGDRFPLLYFFKTYGLDYRAAFSGCSSDTEPSVKTLAYLIDYVRTEEVPAVYHLELSNAAVAEVICESTGAKPLRFYSCQSISTADFQAGETYLSLMWKNVDALKEGLA